MLLHPTSLPGPFGVGDLGSSAYKFSDFLAQTGQSWWQTFPLGPTGYGHSPYQTLSVFAGNPILISLEELRREGLLSRNDVKSPFPFATTRVDYDKARKFKHFCFLKAFDRFEREGSAPDKNAFQIFRQKNHHWLKDFALFMALRRERREAPWWEWPKDLRDRNPRALLKASLRLKDLIRFHEFLQFKFFQQWNRLKTHCNAKRVGLMGDVPIFVAHDSTDVWAAPALFYLDKKGAPTIVAGVPPDYFSKTGQRWGNPLYNWKRHQKTQYAWWIHRFQQAFLLFDAVRLDHFIGFHRFWAIQAKDKTATNGRWRPGPGAKFFKKVMGTLGKREFIAEDLGQVTKEVWELRDQFGFPGMRILQFAFGLNEEAKYHRPENYPANCLVYPGTHDNDTINGWFKDKGSRSSTRSRKQILEELKFAMIYLNSDGKKIHWDVIRTAMMSRANNAIILAQDLLGLDSRARMNRPGTASGNWEWRLKEKELTQKISKRLYNLTNISNRLPS